MHNRNIGDVQMTASPADLSELKAFVVERSRDPAEGLTARQRAVMACIVIPQPIQQWMVEAGAVEPLVDSIEKTILAADETGLELRLELAALADRAEAFRSAIIKSGATLKVPQDTFLDQLRRLEGALYAIRRCSEKNGERT